MSSPGQSFLAREILAMEPVNFLPVFPLAVFIAVTHEVTFGAAFEHSLKIPNTININAKLGHDSTKTRGI